MKILLIGDAHIKANMLDVSKTFSSWLCEVIETHKPSIIVNLGDYFDNHAILRAEALAEYRKFVDFACATHQLPYFHILGNHEMFRPNDGTYHALQSMKGVHKHFYAVDHRLDIANMTFIPYWIKSSVPFPTDTREFLFTHNTFIGADYGSFRPDDGIDQDTVAAELIISGHIHLRQTLGKVIYPGSPIPSGVDDADQVKGVGLLDPDTYQVTFVESPFPKWCSWTMDESRLATVTDDLAAAVNGSKDYWVVNLVGPRAELGAIIESDDFKALRSGHHFRVRTKYTDREKARVKVDATTPESAVIQFVDGVYSGDLDRAEIKRRAVELLNKIKA